LIKALTFGSTAGRPHGLRRDSFVHKQTNFKWNFSASTGFQFGAEILSEVAAREESSSARPFAIAGFQVETLTKCYF